MKKVKKLFRKHQIMILALALMIAVAGYLNFADKKIADEESFASAKDNTVLEEDGVALLDISEEDIASLDSEYVEMNNEYSDIVMDVEENEDLSAFISEAVDSASVEEELAAESSGNEVLTQNSVDEVAQNEEMVVDEVPGEAVFTSTTAISNLADARLLKEQTRARNKENLLEIINNEGLTESQKTDAINSMITLTDISEREMSAEILLEAKGFQNSVVSITGDSADVCVAASELTEVQCAQIIDIVQRKTGVTRGRLLGK